MRRISVIGFGKIGQAVAANILQQDIVITAIDTNPALHDVFERGTYHTNEPGLNEILNNAYSNKRLVITGDFAAVSGSDAVIIAIPLLVDGKKNLLDAPFLDAMGQLAPHLASQMVLIIETSVPVGFARKSVVPSIEAAGKIHGVDFLLAHSPERIKSGTMLEQLLLIPKVIGGISTDATEKALQVYRWFFRDELLHPVESIEAAEMIKLAGMIYRDVNIALSNQFAQFAQAEGIHFADLIPLINTDREANLLQPGIGVGGHCTPVYPYFLIENFKNAGLDFTLARESRSVNDGMAAFAMSLIDNKVLHKKALLLGLSFRPNVKEDAFSTTYLLEKELSRSGFQVLVDDIEFSAEEIEQRGLVPAGDIYNTGAEVLFLVTMHAEYHELDFHKLSASGVKYFIDGRNNIERQKVTAAGIEYFGIGR